MSRKSKSQRRFSKAFKEDKVKMIESGQLTVLQLSRIYSVSSAAIYVWKDKYGSLPKGERLVVEKESEGAKTMALLERIHDLEAALGRKDLENTYMRLVIEKANEHFNCDIEKKSKKA